MQQIADSGLTSATSLKNTVHDPGPELPASLGENMAISVSLSTGQQECAGGSPNLAVSLTPHTS